MRYTVITSFASLLLLLTGCGKSSHNEAPPAPGNSSPTSEAMQQQVADTETPQQAAAAIVGLLKNEDYQALVLERYSEWERTKNMPETGSQEEALEKVSSMFERRRDQMIEVYELLAKAEFTVKENERPQPGETDKMAVASFTYNGRQGEAKLYLMESGRWGFHL